jgi:hypothetical protein
MGGGDRKDSLGTEILNEELVPGKAFDSHVHMALTHLNYLFTLNAASFQRYRARPPSDEDELLIFARSA